MAGAGLLLAVAAAAAPAALAGPVLDVRSNHFPTNFPPGGTGEYEIDLVNVGDAPAGTDPEGDPVTVEVTVPAGMTVTGASNPLEELGWLCGDVSPDGRSVSCTYDPFGFIALAFEAPIGPGFRPCQEAFEARCALSVSVDVAPGAESGPATVVACGGGAASCDSAVEPTTVSSTPAGFGLQRFEWEVRSRDGAPSTQAGGHPGSMLMRLQLNTVVAPSRTDPSELVPRATATPKTLRFRLPRGVIGDPTATPKCSREEFFSEGFGLGCLPASQVGVVSVEGAVTTVNGRFPLYSIEPPPGVVAQFGLDIGEIATVFANATVAPGGGYRVEVITRNISQIDPIFEIDVTLWGTPADPLHDPHRGRCTISFSECPAGALPRPFLANPTDCSASPRPGGVAVESWQDPGVFHTASVDAYPGGLEGCEELVFEPELSVQPTNPRADSPSGYDVELGFGHQDEALVPSHLKDVVLTMPEGVAVNPAAAHGLEACSPEQIALDSPAQPSCPHASRIGSVEIETPVLDHPVRGGMFLAEQGNNPFGSLLAMYLVAKAPGVLIKLPGHIEADPVTGRLRTTFADNPQLPFSDLRVRLKGGPTAPLVNPPTCGEKTATMSLTPWARPGEPVQASSSFVVECPGMGGFSPAFSAGVVEPLAGAFTPFTVRVSRSDREQNIDGLDVSLPEGLLAKIKGVPLCDNARANAGTCPEASRIGTVTTGAGAGASPFFLKGKMFLTEGYKGGPFGLSIVVPTKAGPYDLGDVVVRAAIHVNPVTAEVSADSDPLPTILQGIPLRVRLIQVDVDRDEFMKAPTSCAEQQVRGTVHSLQGSTVDLASRFQVGGCRALAFSPRLRIRLLGRRQMRDGGHPGLKAVLRQPDGQASIRAMAVKLPRALALDPENAQELCEFEAGQRVDCPDSSIIGRARAVSPLLNEPLVGPVYFVKGIRIDPDTGRRIETLPTLLVPLSGEIDIVLRARSQVRGRRANLVSIFRGIPDAPVSRFALRLEGGRNGILATNTNVCDRRRHPARVLGRGHNGKRTGFRIGLRTPCRRAARLAVGRARLEGRRLTVAGRISPRAKRSVRLSVRCAGASLTRLARPNPRGLWTRTIALRARCADASKARIVARYTGDRKVRRARAARALGRG